MKRTARACVAGVAVAVAAAGCGTAAQRPQPAGPSPSPIARMVCQDKAAKEIAQVVGATAIRSAPTWSVADHLYSCDYLYSTGTVVVSVKELSGWGQTYSYYRGLGRLLHRTAFIDGLGQGAFRVRDGSLVVRKDWKVLLVETSGVHGIVGSPGDTPSQLALDTAAVILGCWAGD
jgi:hypothetical protein